MRLIFFSFIFFTTLLQFNLAFSQMPDWKYYRDREGNSYYIDKALKIRISDKINFDFVPVSEKGADYYFYRGVDYINSHNISLGLYYLKSLMCLDSENNRLKKIKADASQWINYLKKNQGTRFSEYDRESTLLHIKKENSFVLINVLMYYSLTFKERPVVIKQGWRNSGKSYRMKLGFRGDSLKQREGYDYIVVVETLDYGFTLKDVGKAEFSWIRKFGTGRMIRNKVSAGENFRIYKFNYPDGSPFVGYEAFFISGTRFHFIKTMCHQSLSGDLLDDMENIVKNFKMVNS